jgi:chemotaxis signal transduction protein
MTAVPALKGSRGAVLVFELGDAPASDDRTGTFGLEVAHLLQVIEPTALSPVPLAPAVVLGIMSYRGRIVTVVDPAPILKSSSRPVLGPDTRVVLLRHGQLSTGNVGLYVSHVREIVPAAELKHIDVTPGSSIGWVAQRGRRLINIIEVEPLLEGLAREFGSHRAFEPRQGVLG